MTMRVPQQAPAPIPFTFGSPLRRKPLVDASGSFQPSFSLGGVTREFELDTIGYGYGLLVHVFGTWTVAVGALVFKGEGIWNYLRRAVLDTPGMADPIDLSGDSLHEQNANARDLSMHNLTASIPRLPSGLDANAWAAANLDDQFANAVAANPVHMWYWVPLERNARDIRGVRSLGHSGQRTVLRLTPSTAADLVTVPANSDTSAVKIEVFEYFYDAASQPVAPPPDGWAVILEETQQLIQAVGKQQIQIDPEGIILNAICRVVLSDAPDTADVSDISLNLDARKLIDEEPLNSYLKWYEQASGIRVPVGTIPFDRDLYAQDPEPIDPTTGLYRGRSWIFSDELVKFFPTIDIAAGAVLGATARITTSIKRLVRL